MFSPKNFMTLGSTFKSLIHCEVIFEYDVREWSSFILLCVVVQFSQQRLLKILYFFLLASLL